MAREAVASTEGGLAAGYLVAEQDFVKLMKVLVPRTVLSIHSPPYREDEILSMYPAGGTRSGPAFLLHTDQANALQIVNWTKPGVFKPKFKSRWARENASKAFERFEYCMSQ